MGTLHANVAFATLIVTHVLVLFFSCIHWENWWSFLVWLPMVVAFFVPAICFNYNAEPMELIQTHSSMDHNTFRNYRELGWTVAAMLLLLAYLIPVLAWYNTGFDYVGVVGVFLAISALVWAYLLWLRVYIWI